jgi:hypothetical protein
VNAPSTKKEAPAPKPTPKLNEDSRGSCRGLPKLSSPGREFIPGPLLLLIRSLVGSEYLPGRSIVFSERNKGGSSAV